MRRYFFKFLFIIYILFLNIVPVYAQVVLLEPANGSVLNSVLVDFKWMNMDISQEYKYAHYHSTSSIFDLSLVRGNLECCEVTRSLQNNRIHYWKIKYHPLESFEGTYDFESEVFVVGINREIPQDILDEFVKEEEVEEEVEEEEEIPKEQEEDIVEEIEEEEGNEEEKGEEEYIGLPFLEDIPKEEEKGVEKIVKNIYSKEEVKNPLEEFVWNVKNSAKVLGTSVERNDVVCKFKYLRKRNVSEKIYCNFPKANILKQEAYPFGNEYIYTIEGKVQRDFQIEVDEYICDFNILKPSTWFKCREKYVESTLLDVSPHMFFRMYDSERNIPVMSYIQNGDSFSLFTILSKKPQDLRLNNTYRLVNTQYNILLSEKFEYPLSFSLDNVNGDSTKPFLFPFRKNIGVTQWYGYTQYQSPHTGIDFGAFKENIQTSEDGEVISKGWDSYHGECLSGGNYVKIKQSNSMYTVYFHLEKIFVNTGDFVKKGDIIGISGNSGYWNCQKLGYHLHFETRLNESMHSHTNPVKYIDINWIDIPTLGYKQYPGRLSGENPHPGR